MKVGITFSPFYSLDAQYLAMLQDAKQHCDYLIVGLQANPAKDHNYTEPSTLSLTERFVQLNNSELIDEIIPYETEQDVEDIMRAFYINIRFVQEKYKEDFIAKDYCDEAAIEIRVFNL
ncbi:glycerol-3-phosphate cytidylyltransferase [Myroides odoratimimus]|uniref:glycerol-3-phosphate cytidylyltransferase n=1 Tax=Myroides odoratimimus TaxID=76832 RepID=UPI002576E84D|nr:glycerol-3-phosphate cytidylyltransferase [Myroides odoratimimus]MDM1465297.1 glycerol-3-phosphate cytidylyltransferase [Myroides odoratimimus]MDM1475301.1 glycerol-3-phosphate cytidylyltransferase [Myroides odoratimimus]MDM1485240.1 glycerol-3-phosphate cytidylyltransferase [Myroides odoratimimus]